MKFEELETLWTAQPSVVPLIADVAQIERSLQPELNRRGRMLGYQAAACVFGLVALPVFTALNYQHDPVRYGGWQLLLAFCQVLVAGLLVVHAIGRLKRHRALRRQPVDTLRAMAKVSLASLEAEMADFRWKQQPILWLALASTVAAIVNSGVRHGWSTAVAGGISTLVLLGFVFSVLWRHYTTNLRPAWKRQTEILRELE